MKVSSPATRSARDKEEIIMPEKQNEREAILNIQKYLRQLSYHDERINPVPIDGIWESDTARAVATFQSQNGLSVTGTVDRATWDALKAAYDESVAQNSPPQPIYLFPRMPQDYSLGIGESGFLNDAVQYMLSELSSIYFFPNFKINDIYNENTADAVRDFQKRNSINPTGRVNRETWDALAVQHNILVNNQ